MFSTEKLISLSGRRLPVQQQGVEGAVFAPYRGHGGEHNERGQRVRRGEGEPDPVYPERPAQYKRAGREADERPEAEDKVREHGPAHGVEVADAHEVHEAEDKARGEIYEPAPRRRERRGVRDVEEPADEAAEQRRAYGEGRGYYAARARCAAADAVYAAPVALAEVDAHNGHERAGDTVHDAGDKVAHAPHERHIPPRAGK